MLLKVLQINLGRGRAAHDLAFLTAEEEKADIIVVSEPKKKLVTSGRWLTDQNKDVAIYIRTKNVGIRGHQAYEGCLKVSFPNFAKYACYISPNISRASSESKIDQITEMIKGSREEAIILGDLNAKSHIWGSPIQDSRGEYLEDWISLLNLSVENTGNNPTFVRRSTGTFIDITLATQDVSGKIKEWKVLEKESLSFHKYICFTVDMGRPKGGRRQTTG